MESTLDTNAVREEAVTGIKNLLWRKWELLSCDKKVKSSEKKHSKASRKMEATHTGST